MWSNERAENCHSGPSSAVTLHIANISYASNLDWLNFSENYFWRVELSNMASLENWKESVMLMMIRTKSTIRNVRWRFTLPLYFTFGSHSSLPPPSTNFHPRTNIPGHCIIPKRKHTVLNLRFLLAELVVEFLIHDPSINFNINYHGPVVQISSKNWTRAVIWFT